MLNSQPFPLPTLTSSVHFSTLVINTTTISPCINSLHDLLHHINPQSQKIMAYSSQLLLAIVLTSFLASSTMISSRKLESKSTLLTRLILDQDGSGSCLDALFELQSCSGEVVLFFLNGETSLGPNCCSAITTIERQCWPSMLGSLGITSEETDILRGYCDSQAAGGGGASTTPPPVAEVQECYNLPAISPRDICNLDNGSEY